MVACYSCHRLTTAIRPHGGILPVYCPRCRREVVTQIVEDVAAAGLLQVRLRPPLVDEKVIPY